ncbi:MAG TPA: transcriptional regulator [Thermoanaerobaculia bacterium]|nr:transcriptional regulator [Thermoanaerobaculia bacterium]
MTSQPPFEQLAGLDRLVHEPARMSIMTALAACRSAEFLFLQRLTGLSKGNLSSHLSKLEEGELVSIEKTFEGKIPRTTVTITAAGRKQIEQHWKSLDRLRKQATGWKPEKENDK